MFREHKKAMRIDVMNGLTIHITSHWITGELGIKVRQESPCSWKQSE